MTKRNFSFKYVYKAWKDRNVTNNVYFKNKMHDKELSAEKI